MTALAFRAAMGSMSPYLAPTGTTEQQAPQLLDLSNWSYEEIKRQLPASIPAEWDPPTDLPEARRNAAAPFTLVWDHEFLIQITDNEWLEDFKATCALELLEEFDGFRSTVPLTKMVSLTFQWILRTASDIQADLNGAWMNMKVVVLALALRCRAELGETDFLMLYPLAYLGDAIALWDETAATKTRGRLHKWCPQDGDEWWCEVWVQDRLQQVKFKLEPLTVKPYLLAFFGEMSRFYQGEWEPRYIRPPRVSPPSQDDDTYPTVVRR